MRKVFFALLGAGAMLAGALLAAPAVAQTQEIVGPHDPYCGAWMNGIWAPNGNCTTETTTTTVTTVRPVPLEQAETMAVPVAAAPMHQRIRGTIVAVNGNMVTLQQANRELVVNDQPALDREASGPVALGRPVVAHGAWQDGMFYVTSFATD